MSHHLGRLHLHGLTTSRLTPNLLQALGAGLGPHLPSARMVEYDGMPEAGTWAQLLQCLPKLRFVGLQVEADDAAELDLQGFALACQSCDRTLHLCIFYHGEEDKTLGQFLESVDKQVSSSSSKAGLQVHVFAFVELGQDEGEEWEGPWSEMGD